MRILKFLNKFILIFFWVSLIGIIGVLVFVNNTKDLVIYNYGKDLKKTFKKNKKNIIPRLMNDYGKKFLPSTHFQKVIFDQKKLNFLELNDCYVEKCYTFFLEEYKNNLFLLEKNGNLHISSIENFIYKKNNFKKVKTNLKFNEITDLYIHNNKIYVSGYIMSEDGSFSLSVFTSKLENLDKIEFQNIFEVKDERCIFAFPHGGKMKYYRKNNLEGILLTTRWMGSTDYPDPESLSENNICGKILIINEKNLKYETFSKGHRNIIGLYVDENVILSTENGPLGGDEINKISYKKNYGWPIASYGTTYFKSKNDNKIYYKKNHEIHDFEEPIFSFIPSIGISEIIKLPNNFSKHWQDNFLIGSLNKKTLYRIKFDKNFNRVIYYEEIFIGDRIRDIIYLENENVILLSLELSGSIGIIKNN